MQCSFRRVSYDWEGRHRHIILLAAEHYMHFPSISIQSITNILFVASEWSWVRCSTNFHKHAIVCNVQCACVTRHNLHFRREKTNLISYQLYQPQQRNNSLWSNPFVSLLEHKTQWTNLNFRFEQMHFAVCPYLAYLPYPTTVCRWLRFPCENW